MSVYSAKMPSLKDKLREQEKEEVKEVKKSKVVEIKKKTK